MSCTFLTPDAIQLTLSKMYHWLKPGGKVFIITDTPYVGYWHVNAPVYLQRKAQGEAWPGFIADVHSLLNTEQARQGPKSVNPLDTEILSRECLAAGFSIERVGYEGSELFAEVKNTPLAGFEHVGIVAVKPLVKADLGDACRGRRELIPEGLMAASLLPTSPPSTTQVLPGVENNLKADLGNACWGRRELIPEGLMAVSMLPTSLPSTTQVLPSVEKQLKPIRDWLRQTLADELQLSPTQMDDDSQFNDLGLNSISGVMWVTKINSEYGLSLKATEIYKYPSLNLFAQHLSTLVTKLKPLPAAAVCESLGTCEPQQSKQVKANTVEPAPEPHAQPKPASKIQSDNALDAIAIIGIAGQYPKAANVEQFWRNIAAGLDCVTEIPANRWNVSDYYDPSGTTPGKSNCKWMGALDDIDCFDPFFFNISPREAELMDPQQRLFLQTCWHCLEDAGIVPSSLSGSRCGVFVGCAENNYAGLTADNANGVQQLTGGATAFLASRISYLLNLQGPSMALDTACSSSLVAIATACDNLILGNCDLALAGGVSIILDPRFYAMGTAANVFSAQGRCFSFDQRADGFVPGEGVGAVLLKRLSDALADGDAVYAVIKGWAVNHDGRSNGMTAPNAIAQTRLQQQVYQRFHINPAQIQLVEAHGTGTALGDPIEIEALTESFKDLTAERHYCALSTVKSNIGHSLLAAGIAGVTKLVLALTHKQLPPTLHFSQLNEHITLEDTPFYINTTLQDWPEPTDSPRFAVINSFGFSGTNAHLVLQEFNNDTAVQNSVEPVLLVLSAKQAPRLQAYAESLIAYLQQNPTLDLTRLSYRLQTGREAMSHRLAVLADTPSAAINAVNDFLMGQVSRHVWTGVVDKHTQLVTDTEEGQEYLARLTANKVLASLAGLWVAGNRIDWDALYAVKPKSLGYGVPVYPFAKERYWGKLPSSGSQTIKPLGLHSHAERGNESNVETDWDKVSYLPGWQRLPALDQTNLAIPSSLLLVYPASARHYADALYLCYQRLGMTVQPVKLVLGFGEQPALHADEIYCDVDQPLAFTQALSQTQGFATVYFIALDTTLVSLTQCYAAATQGYEIQLLRLLKAFQSHCNTISNRVLCTQLRPLSFRRARC
ncbi:beta-ketoacyl synthase N-terminal-like domain-containing protein [Methylocucumis oryzae]|uniref:type I polyketide synthase n=1 Tax=Methylocucumis oryzae TaxID=1632867 RepID=UPI00178D012B|nr:beta-ketoacyl synthase N-terminal-like domain-containing protein [Methylocucumis oryzae]